MLDATTLVISSVPGDQVTEGTFNLKLLVRYENTTRFLDPDFLIVLSMKNPKES